MAAAESTAAAFRLALRHHADDDTHGLLVDCQPRPRVAVITLGNVVDDAREPIARTHTHTRSGRPGDPALHLICMHAHNAPPPNGPNQLLYTDVIYNNQKCTKASSFHLLARPGESLLFGMATEPYRFCTQSERSHNIRRHVSACVCGCMHVVASYEFHRLIVVGPETYAVVRRLCVR